MAGNSGNGAAEAGVETGKAWFIGVDSDQELTFAPELAANTITSGLKNIGDAIIWIFDQWDAGNTFWGTQVKLGIAEGGVGIVTDKNFTKLPQAVQDAVLNAQAQIIAGEIVVDSAISDNEGAMALRDSVQL